MRDKIPKMSKKWGLPQHLQQGLPQMSSFLPQISSYELFELILVATVARNPSKWVKMGTLPQQLLQQCVAHLSSNELIRAQMSSFELKLAHSSSNEQYIVATVVAAKSPF